MSIKRIKTDNRTTFSNQENKVDTTQFGRICIDLGIELITTSVATAKANVEREEAKFDFAKIVDEAYSTIEKVVIRAR